MAAITEGLMRLLGGLVLAVVAFSPAQAGVVADADLARVLDAHVKAVQTRDLGALEKTITSGEQLELIFPNGKRTTTKAEYLAFHKEWFSTSNWTWKLEPLSVVMSDGMAIVTARTHYEEVEDGKTSGGDNWLSLAFRKESGGWRLVHDQNTRVQAAP